MPLSDTKLRNLFGKPYSGEPELSDRDGLSVRISKNGTVTWQYRFRFQKKPARLTLGRYPDLKVKDARDLIPEIRGILGKGLDPRHAWRPNKKDHSVVTVADCVEAFLSKRAPNLKEKTQTLYKSALNRHYKPRFPGRHIEEITHDEWLDWLDGIGEKSPKLSASVLKNGKAFLRWCKGRKMIGHIPLFDINTDDVGVPPDTGDRVLTLREAQAIWKAVERSRAAPTTITAIKLCMLFACRESEIVNATRDHFDMSEMVWTVPKELSKTNVPIRRPITARHEELIRFLWALYGEEGPLLPSDRKEQANISVSSVNKHIERIRKKLNESREVIDHWRCHDFRRTLSTRLSELGIMPHVTEKMLGHILTGVMAVYNKHDWLEEQRKAYELWSDKIIPK